MYFGSKQKIILPEEELPKYYYNILPDLPKELPKPEGNLEVLPKIFAKSLLEQEFSPERRVRIPEEVRELYFKCGRPSPIYRAKKLEEFLKTPARIFFKREDLSPTGSHKLNTALAQAYYIAKDGLEEVTTETGAGQWGSALSLAAYFFGLKCRVFMVKVSYQQKPYRKYVMNFFNAEVIPSPSSETSAGKKALKENPNHLGSLGLAISEAIDFALQSDSRAYSLGSVLNHVLLHQTVIGEEALKQMQSIELMPDYVIGCVGGGSNFSGLAYPFIRQRLKKKEEINFIAVEPKEVPSLTRAPYIFDYGDEAELTPKLKMHSLGHKFASPPIYAGGLRYHGCAPTLSLLKEEGIVRGKAYPQKECFDAAKLFAENEGIIVAPETSHAVKAVIEKALECKRKEEEKTILFNLSGHGLLDLQGYADILKFK
ncbi:MAG: TrpB-like pyridoxal phosphate-dependent enzyme [archaeon]